VDQKEHQEQQRRANTSAHLIRAANAMQLAADATTWDAARSHLKVAAQSMRNAGATVMAP
jgi:hypothetical protein